MAEAEPVLKSNSNSAIESDANDRRTQKAHEALDRLIKWAAVRGFYGEINLKLKMMDGTIQQVHESFEQVHLKV